MEQGYLALVLHAHLPYVRHPKEEKYLEQRWLFEAITETYIPLLQVFQGLLDDKVDFRVTLSLSPTLISMLTDELLQERYVQYLESLIELARAEVSRTKGDSKLNSLAKYYLTNFASVRDFYEQHSRNLVNAFRELQNLGNLEIITSAATHAFLPLILTQEGIRAQISTAVDCYRRNFDREPKGMWLPECGYTPGIEQVLKEFGFEYFFVDSHGVENSNPAPIFGTLSPVLTTNGIAAFPRDKGSSRQVWSSTEGYPGDFDYREYYRDIGYDLDLEDIRPYIHPKGIRHNTGIKYFRITGQGDHKEIYNRDWARGKAADHANNFLQNLQKQVEYWSTKIGRKPIIVSPYDAELFGHWWYEGPIWIDFLLRKLHYNQHTLKCVTPSEYLRMYSDFQVTNLPMSSWGRRGCADVWLREENDWIYPALHLAEQQMVALAEKYPAPNSIERRMLNQAARELMLAQSSDWAFIMDSKTMVDYAIRRTKQHVNRFFKLIDLLQTNNIDESYLANLEQLDNIFPKINYSVYQPLRLNRFQTKDDCKRVLILSWEFPPLTVGGLSRHVFDLSRYMVGGEWEIHVLTTEVAESLEYEEIEGVHVHRVSVLKPHGDSFLDWVLQLNLSMVDTCEKLSSDLHFDLIHAHDWLVCNAAKALKHKLNIPLVTTIHATEHGRNNGIFSDLQRSIHKLEWELCYQAEKVIVCSKYMENEVNAIFQLPPKKVLEIPNGIDPKLLRVSTRETSKYPGKLKHEQVVLFIGRMVREKGVHILLEASPQLLAAFPEARIVCAGTGPMLDELRTIAKRLGVADRVSFPGYVTDEERNRLFANADVAVFPSLYEPFGIVALEAMATGTPVVVSDAGGLNDVVEHGRNGLKVYTGNAQSLADQIKAMLSNPLWARSLARTASSEIGKFDWSRIAARTLEVYNQAIYGLEAVDTRGPLAVGKPLLAQHVK
jgi:1,4-alpha-glucan branching enzyme